MAAQAGMVIAAPQPSANVKPSRSHAFVMPIQVHVPRSAAVTSIQSCVTMR